MALHDMPRARFGGAVLGLAPVALLTRFLAWRDARLTYARLSALSDEMLDDIGLTRSDIRRISRL